MIKRRSILTGALILSAANFAARLLGFVYRIYMSNAIGAEGIGLYQLIMPIYSLAWSLSCAGITTTISKLVAQENAKSGYGNMGRILKQSLLLSVSVAAVIAALIFFGADFLAFNFIKDVRVIMPLRILAFAVPFMAAGSCVRGYYIGLSVSETPAISQVFEQVVRMVVIYALAGTFITRGLTFAISAAVCGIVAGEFLSFLYVFVAYLRFKRKHNLVSKPTLSPAAAMTMIISMALPLTLNRVSGSLLSTFENTLIPQRLAAFGMTQTEALSLYGQITGMAMPLIFFPSAFLTALSVSIVPAVSEALALSKPAKIKSTITKSLLFTSIIGFGAAMLFVVLPDELGKLIYGQDIGEMLLLLGIMCPLWYLGITVSGILNGLGKQLFIFKNSLISSVINIGCIYFLVPRFGVYAFIFGWSISLLVVLISGIIKIQNTSGVHFPVMSFIGKPALAAVASGSTVDYLTKTAFADSLPPVVRLLSCAAVMLAIYLAGVIWMGCVSVKDIKALLPHK